MSEFTIAAAQVPSLRGEIDANILTHLSAIKKAIAEQVNYIVFPELSLTGYELDLAEKKALLIDDPRLDVFRQAAKEGDIIIVIGAPIKNDPVPFLSEIIFFPDGQTKHYAKINVHHSEQPYFNCGTEYIIIETPHHMIANAICADITVKKHIQECVKRKATIYAAGAFISNEDYKREAAMLQDYSKHYGIPVMLANYPHSEHRTNSAGQSAIWINGKKLVSTTANSSSLVIAKETFEGWIGYTRNL